MLSTSLILFALLSVPQEPNPHENEPKIDPARVYTYDRQELVVKDFPADGWILDIGGGGEGVIGRIKGSQVVAIDLYAWGMRRTPPGPLKLVMDATDLKFLDGSFGTVTSFFTLMYMNPEQQEKAVREAFRVLKPGGVFRIWDVMLPNSPDPKQDIVVFPFTFHLPKETIKTGYGTAFPKQVVDGAEYIRLARVAGFTVERQEVVGRTFNLVLRKR